MAHRVHRRLSLSPRRPPPKKRSVMPTIFEAALTDYARGLRAPAVGRAFTLGASDIGQCARKAFFVKHNGERDPGYVDTWGAALRGQIIEQAFWVPALRAHFGANLKF